MGAVSSLFDLVKNGNAAVGKDTWLSLDTIPTGYKIWIGSSIFTAIDKNITCEIRTNLSGLSVGDITSTSILSKSSIRTGTTVNTDLYRKGRLHIISVVGSGVEKWWLHLTSKTTTLGTVVYYIYYTTE